MLRLTLSGVALRLHVTELNANPLASELDPFGRIILEAARIYVRKQSRGRLPSAKPPVRVDGESRRIY